MSKYKKGQSGNLNGRPKGNAYASKLREAIQNDIPDIIAAIVDKAKNGDISAAKLLLDRVIPPLKPKDSTIELTGLEGSISEQAEIIIQAMAQGKLSPSEAITILRAVDSQDNLTRQYKNNQRSEKIFGSYDF